MLKHGQEWCGGRPKLNPKPQTGMVEAGMTAEEGKLSPNLRPKLNPKP
jgi:hypothetical protein